MCQNVSVGRWQISTNGGSTFVDLDNGSPTTLDIKLSSFVNRNTETLVVKCISTDSNVYDTITLQKIIDVTELEVGGINLVRGTKDFVNDHYRETGFQTGTAFTTNVDSDGFTELITPNITGLTENAYLSAFSSLFPCKQGETFTVSFWVKIGDISTWSDRRCHIWEVYDDELNRVEYQDVDLVSASNTNKPSVVSGEWIYVTSRHTIAKEESVRVGVRFCLFKNGQLSFKKLKVERGTLATDWSPHPDDVRLIIDSNFTTLLERNGDIYKKIEQVTSDDHISEQERENMKLIYQEIVAQKNSMINTITAMEVDSLNSYKTQIEQKFNDITKYALPIINGTGDTGGNTVRQYLSAFYGVYNSALYGISTYTKKELNSVQATLTQQEGRIEMSVTQSTDALEQTVKMGKHMQFDNDWLELYGTINGDASQFKARLSNQKLSFYDSNNEVAYISNQTLNINNAQINQNLQVDSISISPSGNGGVVFKLNK